MALVVAVVLAVVVATDKVVPHSYHQLGSELT